MIKTKSDLRYYLLSDQYALGYSNRKHPRIFTDDIWKFQILLRKFEFYTNVKNKLLGRIIYNIIKLKFTRISTKLGFSIPPNVFGPGLSIAHYGTIIVNSKAKIGENCRIHACVVIGAQLGSNGRCVPTIGNNVYIGPGAKIFGKIEVHDDVVIGANTVVNKDVEENKTVVGIPFKVIKDKGSEGLFIRGTKEVDNITLNRV